MPIRILTMNVYNGGPDTAAFASALEIAEPDVVAVQELTEPIAEVLEKWSSDHLLDPRDDTTGLGLASRLPAAVERLEFPHRDPVRARIDASAEGLATVDVVNAHIVNPIARPVLESRRLRRQELAALIDLFGGSDDPIVLVGDLNSSPAWPLYRKLAEVATDGAVEAGTARRTWGYYPNSPAMLRIDHVFTRGVRCLSTRLVRLPGADHRGVVADIDPLR